jgi:hypothetical protein
MGTKLGVAPQRLAAIGGEVCEVLAQTQADDLVPTDRDVVVGFVPPVDKGLEFLPFEKQAVGREREGVAL